GLARFVGNAGGPPPPALEPGSPAAAAAPPADGAGADADADLDIDSTRRLEARGDDRQGPASPPGAGRALSVELTHAGVMVGTPGYMSPEQFSAGEIGASADQFSFCVA